LNVDAETDWKASLSRQALNSLSLNNRRVEDGSDEVLMNPAYENQSDDEVKGMIEEILSTLPLTATLRQIEDSNCSKFGPRSLAKNWGDRKDDLLAYFVEEDYDPGELEAISGRLRPASVDMVAKSLLKSSSAGLPYMQRKGLILDEALKDWSTDKGLYPCVLYTRTQEQGKTRTVWGYPVSDTIFEQRYFIPVLKIERKFAHRAAIVGPSAVDAAITRLIMDRLSGIMFCVDFSAYDASVTPKHSYAAFKELGSLFAAEHHPALYDIYRRFATIGIYTPEGEWSGPHGVPSGSTFTNTIDSMVQWQVSGHWPRCQIQGDDGVYLCKNESELDYLKQCFVSAGLKLNEDKSNTFESDEVIYLQRYYHPDYRSREGGLGGVYSAYRAFNRIKYLERWTDFKKEDISGSDFFSLRTITILENCKHHPGFEGLVKMAHKLDRAGLAYTSQGLAAYSRSLESKARAGVFNQYGLQVGIGNFETVKILAKL
jgi:hypothetical protein